MIKDDHVVFTHARKKEELFRSDLVGISFFQQPEELLKHRFKLGMQCRCCWPDREEGKR